MPWFAVAGIGFVTACFSSESIFYYLFESGIPLIFFLFQMRGSLGKDLESFKYLTVYMLFPAKELISGDAGAFWPCVVLALLRLVLSGAGCVYFWKREFSA